jgi:tetratricopeptide (TPR) repeat protein
VNLAPRRKATRALWALAAAAVLLTAAPLRADSDPDPLDDFRDRAAFSQTLQNAETLESGRLEALAKASRRSPAGYLAWADFLAARLYWSQRDPSSAEWALAGPQWEQLAEALRLATEADPNAAQPARLAYVQALIEVTRLRVALARAESAAANGGGADGARVLGHAELALAPAVEKAGYAQTAYEHEAAHFNTYAYKVYLPSPLTLYRDGLARLDGAAPDFKAAHPKQHAAVLERIHTLETDEALATPDPHATRAVARAFWTTGPRARAWALSGQIQLIQGHYALAQRDLRQAVAQDKGWWGGHALLGKALLQQGRLKEAAQHLQEALRLAPGHADPWADLAYCETKLGRKGALGHYRGYLERCGQDGTYVEEASAALKAAGQTVPEQPRYGPAPELPVYRPVGVAVVRGGMK